MPKPSNVTSLKTRPRRPVPEDVARKLEEAAEAQGNRMAGESQPEPTSVSEPSGAHQPVAAEPRPVSTEPQPVAAEKSSVALEPEAVVAEPAPVSAEPEAVAAEPVPVQHPQIVSSDGEATGAASAAAQGAVGTMGNPRRRRDGVRTRTTSLHVPLELSQQLRMHCAATGRRQNDVIIRALTAYLDTVS